MSNLLNLEKVTKSYGVRILLDEVSLGVGEGERIGVVGRNGDGKTTLLNLMAGREEPDSGRISHTRGLRVGYLDQRDLLDDSHTVREVVLAGRADHEWAADARTREVVDVVRQVLAREAPVTNDGPHHPLPYTGPGSVGLGKPLKSIVHPLRADVPIWLGAEGPKNVAQTAEIADGWIPLFYSPASAGMYAPWLDEGFARPGARRTRADFEIAASCHLEVTDDKAGALAALKPSVALYMGGMGAKEQNFHNAVFVRMASMLAFPQTPHELDV